MYDYLPLLLRDVHESDQYICVMRLSVHKKYVLSIGEDEKTERPRSARQDLRDKIRFKIQD